jgi:hypothetical protein
LREAVGEDARTPEKLLDGVFKIDARRYSKLNYAYFWNLTHESGSSFGRRLPYFVNFRTKNVNVKACIESPQAKW